MAFVFCFTMFWGPVDFSPELYEQKPYTVMDQDNLCSRNFIQLSYVFKIFIRPYTLIANAIRLF